MTSLKKRNRFALLFGLKTAKNDRLCDKILVPNFAKPPAPYSFSFQARLRLLSRFNSIWEKRFINFEFYSFCSDNSNRHCTRDLSNLSLTWKGVCGLDTSPGWLRSCSGCIVCWDTDCSSHPPNWWIWQRHRYAATSTSSSSPPALRYAYSPSRTVAIAHLEWAPLQIISFLATQYNGNL